MDCFSGNKLSFESLGGEGGHRKPYLCGTQRLLSPVTSSPMLRRALSEEGITEDGVPEAEG